MGREIRNAKITDVSLGYEDHGLLTIYVQLDYGGAGQSFGGYRLDKWSAVKNKSVPAVGCGAFIAGLLKTFEVEEFSKLKGLSVRADADWGKVYRIGHFLKDKWFDPEEMFRELGAE